MTSVLIFNDSGAWVIIFQYVNIIEYELSMRDMHSFEKRVRNVDFPTRGIYRLTFVLAKRIMIIKSFVDSTSLSTCTCILKDKGRWTIPFSRYWKSDIYLEGSILRYHVLCWTFENFFWEVIDYHIVDLTTWNSVCR